MRSAPPRLRRDGREWLLELPGEPPSPVALADHDPVVRALEAERDGIDVVGIALSVPLGIELLPAAEAQPLLDAFHDGVAELGGPFRFWAATALTAPGAGALEIDALLDRGAIGATRARGRARQRGRPRPALGAAVAAGGARRAAVRAPRPGAGRPSRRAAVVAGDDRLRGRHARRLARLGGVGAGLASAPARAVRDAGRRARRCTPSASPPAAGPPRRCTTSSTYFDVSSYGPRTVDAMLRVVGADRLVHGSDRPVAEPPVLDALGPSVAHALTEANPARLLSPDPVTA